MPETLELASVIIPAYNAAGFLTQAVASVSAQTYGRWELFICVDPESNDDTARLARTLAAGDGRITAVFPTAGGVAAARNSGLRAAHGRYLAFLDSDDLWLPCKLSEQIRRMSKQGADFSCTRFRRWKTHADGPHRAGHLIALPARITYHRLLQQNCILTSTVILDRRVHGDLQFKEIGCEDFDLWLRILKAGGYCLGIQQDLLRYRIVSGSRGSDKWKSLRETWRIYRNSAGMNRLQSSAVMMPFLTRNLVKYSRF